MNKYKKCKAEIYSFGLDTKPANLSVIELIEEDGVIPKFNIIYSLNELKAHNFDYILSMNAKANAFIETEFNAPLKFNYNFNLPEKETKEDIDETRKEIKQYVERFCKMYLNEYQ